MHIFFLAKFIQNDLLCTMLETGVAITNTTVQVLVPNYKATEVKRIII